MYPWLPAINWALLGKFSSWKMVVFFVRYFPVVKPRQEPLDDRRTLKFKNADVLTSLNLLLMIRCIYHLRAHVCNSTALIVDFNVEAFKVCRGCCSGRVDFLLRDHIWPHNLIPRNNFVVCLLDIKSATKAWFKVEAEFIIKSSFEQRPHSNADRVAKTSFSFISNKSEWARSLWRHDLLWNIVCWQCAAALRQN